MLSRFRKSALSTILAMFMTLSEAAALGEQRNPPQGCSSQSRDCFNAWAREYHAAMLDETSRWQRLGKIDRNGVNLSPSAAQSAIEQAVRDGDNHYRHIRFKWPDIEAVRSAGFSTGDFEKLVFKCRTAASYGKWAVFETSKGQRAEAQSSAKSHLEDAAECRALRLGAVTKSVASTSQADLQKRFEELIAVEVGKAIKPFGATLDPGNVVVDPNPSNTLGDADLRLHIDVKEQDCAALEAISKSLEVVARLIARPHGVAGIRYIAVMTDAKGVRADDKLIDRRDVPADELAKLRKANARPALYLGLGQLASKVFLEGRNTEVFASCIQKLCAPEIPKRCTAVQDTWEPGGARKEVR
jgi:hypothetical protein